jgi:hypothetical protein
VSAKAGLEQGRQHSPCSTVWWRQRVQRKDGQPAFVFRMELQRKRSPSRDDANKCCSTTTNSAQPCGAWLGWSGKKKGVRNSSGNTTQKTDRRRLDGIRLTLSNAIQCTENISIQPTLTAQSEFEKLRLEILTSSQRTSPPLANHAKCQPHSWLHLSLNLVHGRAKLKNVLSRFRCTNLIVKKRSAGPAIIATARSMRNKV